MSAERQRRHLVVRGVVQGVGFRPFVYTTAAELSLSGSVANDSSGVIIDIEGTPADLDEFIRRLRDRPPPLAVIESIDRITVAVRGGTGFHIVDTTRADGGRTLASPDVAICADCAAELADPTDRRHRHPFINCTNCGPRFTIITDLPYDRSRTSMADFPMCSHCTAEYTDPTNRRFHAQPIACPDCGPRLTYTAVPLSAATTDDRSRLSRSGRSEPETAGATHSNDGVQPTSDGPNPSLPAAHRAPSPTSDAAAALTAARELLREGGILAVKGIGGYHLACDATNEDAVATLRSRKRRGDKPFAVMVADLATARAIAEVDDIAAALLSGPQRPIVLLARKAPISYAATSHATLGSRTHALASPVGRGIVGLGDLLEGDRADSSPSAAREGHGQYARGTATPTGAEAPGRPESRGLDRGAIALAPSVAPRNPDLGVLLAYTPLHLLLFGLPGDPPGPQVLVMTSGNLGGEPICYDDEDAGTRLAGLADGWLSHDRRILTPCDDSVLRVVDGIELPLRRSRGYAPLPLTLPVPVPPTLAVGADLKNTCAVGDGRYAWLSQHIGDMDDLATLRAFGFAAEHLAELTGVAPTQLVVDAHPGYRSTAWARTHAEGRLVRTVQHHHAHIAAVMGEHGLGAAETVAGIAFDGTGFGPDGAIWGGEVLAAGYKGYRRLAHLRYVPLAGGDTSVHRPYRMALAHLRSADLPWSDTIASVAACPADERAVLTHQFDTGLGCTPTSSMGRLFDAVASLAGVRHTVDYEAQAAIELEAIARGVDPGAGTYRFALDHTADPAVIDPAPVVAAVVRDAGHGVPAAVIAARFHHAVARLVLDLARDFAPPPTTVALSGGVFQNALLLSAARTLLRDNGFPIITHRRLPPNDGGLAFGQLLAGAG
ncbi:carbamoyltransferase HypF [Nocardia mangyaensis]|uniref:carbamoyltransferase HypF n=1 Tax=Nocardia mangyaensis TaxID=2213200 RepID=UPI0009FE2B39|nr:carbamoyltransferase HypF [Nocardia mangyaensis]